MSAIFKLYFGKNTQLIRALFSFLRLKGEELIGMKKYKVPKNFPLVNGFL